jgi:hypothetical protein
MFPRDYRGRSGAGGARFGLAWGVLDVFEGNALVAAGGGERTAVFDNPTSLAVGRPAPAAEAPRLAVNRFRRLIRVPDRQPVTQRLRRLIRASGGCWSG